jgi:hypothetical protein
MPAKNVNVLLILMIGSHFFEHFALFFPERYGFISKFPRFVGKTDGAVIKIKAAAPFIEQSGRPQKTRTPGAPSAARQIGLEMDFPASKSETV